MAETHQIVVDLIGGESFLYPDLCDQIFSYALELGQKFHKCVFLDTCTNGTTLINEKVRELIEKYKNYNFSLGISIVTLL